MYNRWHHAAVALALLVLVLLKSSYQPQSRSLDDGLLSYNYSSTWILVAEPIPANSLVYSMRRKLKADCHWDVRKLKTVCLKADGSVWVGPAGDKIERKDGATAELVAGKAIREPKLESAAAASRAAARGVTAKKPKPSKKNDEDSGDEADSEEDGDGGEDGSSEDDTSGGGSSHRSSSRSSNSGSLPPLKGRKQRLKQGEPLECSTQRAVEHDLLPGGGASGLKPFSSSSSSSKDSAVNSVILFVVDDLQPDGVSSFGVRPRPSSERIAYKFMRTPKLDEIAQGGALFARAYTPHPLCSPSRYAILTGRYASRSRRLVEMALRRSQGGDPPLSHITLNGNAWVVQGTRTLAHAFQQAGFRTGMTGKWHLSSTVETETKGFTYQDAANSPKPMAAEVAEVQAAGFDDVFALYPINMKDSGFSWFSHNPEFQAVTAMDWWDTNRNKGQGRFLYFAFTLPHMPKSGLELGKNAATRVPDPRGKDSSSKPSADAAKRINQMRDRSRAHVMAGKAVGAHNAGGSNWAGGNDKVHNVPGVLWIDAIMGEWVDFLKKTKELDHTLMVFTADHGCIAKGHCFEPGMRIPLFMHCPQLIPKGRVVDAVAANIDLAPTLLDACGLTTNWLRDGGKRLLDGRSLLPLVAPHHARFAPGKEVHPEGIYCEIYSDRSIVAPNYTLVDLSRTHYESPPYNRKPWGDRIQLYKANDCEQRTNLVTKAARHEDPVAAHAMAALQKALQTHIVDTVPKCQKKFGPQGFPTKLTSSVKHSYQDFKMPWPKTPPFRVVPTARFSVFAPAYPIAKDGAIELNEDFYSTIGPEPVRDLGVGDSALLLDLFDDSDGAPQLFEEVRNEVHWHEMMHKGGAVPRLVSMQGSFVYGPPVVDDKNSAPSLAAPVAEPVYRHPADAQPPMVAWTPAVLRAKMAAEKALGGQIFNHALVQHYRNGDDYISEHADKTLDVARGSAIVNVSLGATRTMVLRTKKGHSSSRSSSDSTTSATTNEHSSVHSRNSALNKRATQRIALPGGSVFVLGWATNLGMTHEIRQDKRMSSEKKSSEQVCNGERISITFRTVATFQRLRDGYLFGQGARCKTEAALDARLAEIAKELEEKENVVDAKASGCNRSSDHAITPAIPNTLGKTVSDDANTMVAMFGEENMSPTFNWDRCYGMGFDALNMATAQTASTVDSKGPGGSSSRSANSSGGSNEEKVRAASMTVAPYRRSPSEAAAEAAVRTAFCSFYSSSKEDNFHDTGSVRHPSSGSSSSSCRLVPHDFFCAWGGVLVLAFTNFPPPLRNLKAALNEACEEAATKAGKTARGENFGSKWPKATLAATADTAPPLTLQQLATLRRVCIEHGTALRQSLVAAQSIRRSSSSVHGSEEDEALEVAVTTVTVVHYKHRGLEALPGRHPPRLVPFSLLRQDVEECAEEVRGLTKEEEEDKVMQPVAVRCVVEEWCGDRLSSYLSGANQEGSEASSYRDSSPSGSTVVAFLNGSGPRSARVLSEEERKEGAVAASTPVTGPRSNGVMPRRLAKALRAFRSAVDRAFPGRFIWMDEDSLHCTLRSLDW